MAKDTHCATCGTELSRGFKPQRIRDPLHNLIEFKTDQFEHTIWRVIQTPPFQRLRRIRQLGFSEFVFPGATHTRFAHSIGVFHTARQLIGVIQRFIGADGRRQYREHQAEVALAAALVHDVGHGMFSHAFEEVGEKLKLPMAEHETVSRELIRDSEIKHELRELGSGFADDVAKVIDSKKPGSLYDTVVSSQFDADRLDYMQRDRLMTGIQSSGIDATWLMANLEIASVALNADGETSGSIETLVLGPKAFHAAENYVLSLFQLYPNVYFHKTTRAAEKLFASLLTHLITLIRDGSIAKTGLPENHPIARFAREPEKLSNALALDDTVFWGALPLMLDATDEKVAKCAKVFRERMLPKCLDIRIFVDNAIPLKPGMSPDDHAKRKAQIRLACKDISKKIESLPATSAPGVPRILLDETRRTPYKKFEDSKGLLNQILIRQGDRNILDMADISPVVASAETFEVCRVYTFTGDTDANTEVENIMRTSIAEVAK